MAEIRYWEICPHCKSTEPGFVVIQNAIDLNWTLSDELNDLLVELWQCGECGKYIKVYSRIEKIRKLTEETDKEILEEIFPPSGKCRPWRSCGA